MKQAYGVTSNAEFSNLTKIPISTMSNWLSRDSIPFRYVYECANATGKDVDWLLSGELANASLRGAGIAKFTGEQSIYNEILKSGGQALLQRLMLAYGFTMQKQLGELLGLSSGTMSTWVRRNHFPGDVVVACALDTGVSLSWLATGKGNKFEAVETASSTVAIPCLTLSSGKLEENGVWAIDKDFVPKQASKPAYIKGQTYAWIIDKDKHDVANGRWILSIDGIHDVYDVTRIPSNKIQVKLINSGTSFVCDANEVECIGQVIFSIERNI
ncbi:helix-turn-helix domain-containing protein [Enterobacter roggenkampii]|uniref:helix-turn-helix domain-containing protein n=1 Tax=Enterobacter roggenkampii TaxID=1812935 RepID=UPI003D6DC0E1